MAFFFFRKKFELGKGHRLSQIPLFSSLSNFEFRQIEKRIRLAEFKKGDWIYREGEEGQAFYVIVSGRVKIYKKTDSGEQKAISTLCRGEYFGEVALLTDSERTVSAQAQNDTLILQIDKTDFKEILEAIPSVSLHLNRMMGVRLSRQSEEFSEDIKIVSVHHIRRGIGKTTFLHNLAASLKRETNRNVIVLNLISEPTDKEKSIHLDDVDFSPEAEWRKKIEQNDLFSSLLIEMPEVLDAAEQKTDHLVSLMSHLLKDFNYVIVDLPCAMKEPNLKVIEQSDAAYLITDKSPESLEDTRKLLRDFKERFKLIKNQIRILTLESPLYKDLSMRNVEKIIKFPVFHELPREKEFENTAVNPWSFVLDFPDKRYSRIVRYLARELGDILTGLALGSGAAFGLAHIGVLKVLEEEGVEIDVVAGSSIGGVIGMCWAAGMSASQIEAEAKKLKGWNAFFKLVGLRDLVLPPSGFFRGRKMYHYLKSLVGDIHFKDLKKPLLVPATNLFTSEEVVFREGEVARAVRASVAIPGIVVPPLVDGQRVTDGGIVDPLPVELLQEMGCRKTIAVNVLSSPDDIKEGEAFNEGWKEDLDNRIEEGRGFKKLRYLFLRRLRRKKTISIFNVLMSTIQFMEFTLAKAQSIDADVVIHPALPGAGWADFHDPEKFIKIGINATKEAMPEIKKLVEER